ncbi:MAG: type II toxin-antitoxin system HicA family toxin [Chloroflexi bacterium]|nr:type II toxin-antitoxin system HicA family toxin [Chloroflexota bacterium]
MRISGRQLIRLLEIDGWQVRGRATHGVFLFKKFPGETIPRTTVVPDKADDLPDGTLGAILGVKQTGLGRTGLKTLIEKHGLG